jgi:hypothetical protein
MKSAIHDAYLETIERMEPEISPVDPGAFYASAAISLKRIADNTPTLRDQFAMAVLQGLMSSSGVSLHGIVDEAYIYADSMLKAREENKGG